MGSLDKREFPSKEGIQWNRKMNMARVKYTVIFLSGIYPRRGAKTRRYFVFHKIFSTIIIPSSSTFSLIGSQICFSYGASIPCVLSAGYPSSSNWAAMPQVTPTDFDIAEYPFESPSNSSVEVRVSYYRTWAGPYRVHQAIHTSLPSSHSITNLCWSMTKSRSPGWKLKSFSNCIHRVSKRFLPRMVAFSEVKRPK